MADSAHITPAKCVTFSQDSGLDSGFSSISSNSQNNSVQYKQFQKLLASLTKVQPQKMNQNSGNPFASPAVMGMAEAIISALSQPSSQAPHNQSLAPFSSPSGRQQGTTPSQASTSAPASELPSDHDLRTFMEEQKADLSQWKNEILMKMGNMEARLRHLEREQSGATRKPTGLPPTALDNYRYNLASLHQQRRIYANILQEQELKNLTTYPGHPRAPNKFVTTASQMLKDFVGDCETLNKTFDKNWTSEPTHLSTLYYDDEKMFESHRQFLAAIFPVDASDAVSRATGSSMLSAKTNPAVKGRRAITGHYARCLLGPLFNPLEPNKTGLFIEISSFLRTLYV